MDIADSYSMLSWQLYILYAQLYDITNSYAASLWKPKLSKRWWRWCTPFPSLDALHCRCKPSPLDALHCRRHSKLPFNALHSTLCIAVASHCYLAHSIAVTRHSFVRSSLFVLIRSLFVRSLVSRLFDHLTRHGWLLCTIIRVRTLFILVLLFSSVHRLLVFRSFVVRLSLVCLSFVRPPHLPWLIVMYHSPVFVCCLFSFVRRSFVRRSFVVRLSFVCRSFVVHSFVVCSTTSPTMADCCVPHPRFICSSIRLFVCSFIHLFVCLFVCSFERSFVFVRSFVHSFIHSSVHSFICSVAQFVQSFVYSFIRLSICSFVRSFIHSFVRSFISIVVVVRSCCYPSSLSSVFCQRHHHLRRAAIV